MTLAIGGPLFLVGAGKMGGALLSGWLERGLDPKSVFIQEPAAPDALAEMAKKHGIRLINGPDELPATPRVMVLAVKSHGAVWDLQLSKALTAVGALVGGG